MPVQIYNVQRQDRGSSLKLIFLLRNQCNNDFRGNLMTETYLVNDIAQVRFKFKQKAPQNSLHLSDSAEFSISFMISTKLALEEHPLLDVKSLVALTKNQTVKLNVSCKAFDYSEELICTDKWTDWITMGEKNGTHTNKSVTIQPIEVNMVISTTKTVTFANLFKDEDLTDFYLGTPEGKVAVHKACLAAHSDVFKTMLSSKQWKETADGQLNIQGATLNTLENLKKYVYLGSLPDDDDMLRQLLILASCYMMETLKTECITKLTSRASPENLYNLVEYACENNIPELMIAILEQTPDEIIQHSHEERLKQIVVSHRNTSVDKN